MKAFPMEVVKQTCSLAPLRWGVLLVVGLGGASCASQQSRFSTIDHRDQLRFAACRHEVARHICPDDPDCDVRASELYAAEPPRARRQFLLDYGCSRDVIDHVDQLVRQKERQASGMP